MNSASAWQLAVTRAWRLDANKSMGTEPARHSFGSTGSAKDKQAVQEAKAPGATRVSASPHLWLHIQFG